MTKIKQSNSTEVLTRLRKIEGQAKGLQKMVHENRHCADIANQITATSHALDGVMMQILREHIHNCMFKVTCARANKENLKELFQIIERVIK